MWMPCQKESWKLNVFYPEVFLLLLIGHTLALVIVFVLLNKKLHSINVSLQLYKWVPTNLCEGVGGGGGAITQPGKPPGLEDRLDTFSSLTVPQDPYWSVITTPQTFWDRITSGVPKPLFKPLKVQRDPSPFYTGFPPGVCWEQMNT